MYQRIGVITFIAYALPAIFDIALPLSFRSSAADAAACMGSPVHLRCRRPSLLHADVPVSLPPLTAARKRNRANIFLANIFPARHGLRFNYTKLCDMLNATGNKAINHSGC